MKPRTNARCRRRGRAHESARLQTEEGRVRTVRLGRANLTGFGALALELEVVRQKLDVALLGGVFAAKDVLREVAETIGDETGAFKVGGGSRRALLVVQFLVRLRLGEQVGREVRARRGDVERHRHRRRGEERRRALRVELRLLLLLRRLRLNLRLSRAFRQSIVPFHYPSIRFGFIGSPIARSLPDRRRASPRAREFNRDSRRASATRRTATSLAEVIVSIVTGVSARVRRGVAFAEGRGEAWTSAGRSPI